MKFKEREWKQYVLKGTLNEMKEEPYLNLKDERKSLAADSLWCCW